MIIYKNKTRLRRKHQLRHSLSQYAVIKAINVRPRARGRGGGVWSALWVIKRKQRELIALAANLILLIYAFNCALCIVHYRTMIFEALAP